MLREEISKKIRKSDCWTTKCMTGHGSISEPSPTQEAKLSSRKERKKISAASSNESEILRDVLSSFSGAFCCCRSHFCGPLFSVGSEAAVNQLEGR